MLRILLLILGLFVGAAAQERQVNIVIEVQAESEPVQGAAVQVNGTTVHTDAQGTARVSVPPGEVAIAVSHEGLLPARTTATVEDTGREHQFRFDMHEAEGHDEQITVYATRTDKRLQDLPTRVEVLSRDEIEEKMLMTPGDITMMLNEMGGMRVQTTSPSLGAASVRIQGMRGRYTRFLSDGLPLFGQQGAGLGLLQIPPMDLGQVEVVKGASSALYGAGALGGIVNLIARRPSAEPVHEVLLNRSTLGATDATVFLAPSVRGAWGGSLLVGGHWQERRDLDDDGWADLATYGRGIARPRVHFDNGRGTTALVTGGVTWEDRTGGSMPGRIVQQIGGPWTESLDTNRYDFGATVQTLAGESVVLTGRLAASSQRHAHLFGDVLERDRHQLLLAEASARGVLNRHTWVAGAAVERDSYTPGDVPQFRYVYVVPGVFLQDDVDVTSWLSLSAGARVDFHNRYGTFLSPRLAGLLRWQGWTARMAAGQGFFAPTPLAEETEAAGLARLSIPAPLRAERGRSASLDLTRSVGPASFTFTLFASQVSHPIRVERSLRYELVNLAEPTKNRGAEVLATFRRAPFALTGSYTYVRSREQEDGTTLDVPLTPRHSAGIVGMWEQEDTGRIGLECYYTGRQRLEVNPWRSVSKPYVLVGALVERRVGVVRLFFNAENITNVRQTRWDPLLRPNRSVDGRWTVDAWVPLEGRVFNGGVRLRF